MERYRVSLMILIIFGIAFLSVTASIGQSDTDSISKQLEPVVITATRTMRKLSNVAVPVTVVSQKAIRQSGALRLNNILKEQTGLYVTNSFGNGVQVQGLGPDYVLILVDGEPLVGRNGGVLDLNRVTVNNIRQIEIVKGPSSSLYGSEAMGGVINIITDASKSNALYANLRYGSYNTVDANAGGSFSHKRFNLSAFVNRNSSSGYDFNKKDTGKTVMPFHSYTAQVKAEQGLGSIVKAGISLRYYNEKQQTLYSTDYGIAQGSPRIREYNIYPFIRLNFSPKIQSVFRGNFSQFESETMEYVKAVDTPYYNDFFQQRFHRIENQTDIKLLETNDLTLGAGYTWERLNTNRYSNIKHNTTAYIFIQDEHRFGDRAVLIGGLRYDNNAAYASRLSPKLAVRVKATAKLSVNASYGAGFKAPDFRQLYLNFTNNAAGGYTVYGANETSAAQLQQQLQAGILSSITPYGNTLKLLEPEYSRGINIGADYQFNTDVSLKVNAFRNDIDNLIITRIIAYKPSNAPVYSYFNVNSAYTEGIETNLKWHINKNLSAEGGYQFLLTADKEVLRQVKEGKMFGKNPGSLQSVQVTRKDYGGLTDRSRHMANFKIFYEQDAWFATLRGIYRSRWGVADVDGNLILNRDDEYAKGSFQLNVSGGRSFGKTIDLKAGIDNLTNVRDKRYMTDNPGISFYIAFNYRFFQKNNQ